MLELWGAVPPSIIVCSVSAFPEGHWAKDKAWRLVAGGDFVRLRSVVRIRAVDVPKKRVIRFMPLQELLDAVTAGPIVDLPPAVLTLMASEDVTDDSAAHIPVIWGEASATGDIYLYHWSLPANISGGSTHPLLHQYPTLITMLALRRAAMFLQDERLYRWADMEANRAWVSAMSHMRSLGGPSRVLMYEEAVLGDEAMEPISLDPRSR